MASSSRFRRGFAVVGMVAVAGFVLLAARGWSEKRAYSAQPLVVVAQDVPKAADPAPQVPPSPADPALPPSSLPNPVPQVPPALVEPSPVTPAAIAPAAAPSPVSALTDAPEDSAAEFLDRSRREASLAVETLSAEADSLRARLAKTEAGLTRWKSILDALESQSQPPTRPSPSPEPAAAVRDLEPVREPFDPQTPKATSPEAPPLAEPDLRPAQPSPATEPPPLPKAG